MFFFMAICMKKVSNICNGNENMLVSKLRERERERERERVVGSIQARRRRVGYICKLRERRSHGW